MREANFMTQSSALKTAENHDLLHHHGIYSALARF